MRRVPRMVDRHARVVALGPRCPGVAESPVIRERRRYVRADDPSRGRRLVRGGPEDGAKVGPNGPAYRRSRPRAVTAATGRPRCRRCSRSRLRRPIKLARPAPYRRPTVGIRSSGWKQAASRAGIKLQAFTVYFRGTHPTHMTATITDTDTLTGPVDVTRVHNITDRVAGTPGFTGGSR